MKKLIVHEDERVGKWLNDNFDMGWRSGTICIGLEDKEKLIAGVLYDWYNKSSIYMHVGAYGKKWLTREYLWACFHYPFIQLNCKVLIGLVGSKNDAAKKFDEHLGFKLHTKIPHAHPDGELLVYIMNREDCRFLGVINEQTKTAAAA